MMSGSAQVATLVLRTASLIVLAHLLPPTDFGLVAMVTAVTGFVSLFRDAGLPMASISSETVSNEQLSTLFWVNLGVGVMIAAGCALLGPPLGAFYREPRLVSISAVIGVGFIWSGGAAQHRAILERSLRFGTVAVADLVGLVIGLGLGVLAAMKGMGYWALVITTVVPPACTAVVVWSVTGWKPGRPRFAPGTGPMLRYGSTVTLNTLVVYIAYNADKILLGRIWGAATLGFYSRAYQLINLPTDNLNSTLAQVAFPALARLQGDPVRLRSYFLRGYGVFLAIVLPIVAGCALFAPDIVRVFLGARWMEAAAPFRLLSPTILVFAMINPLGWFMMATGHAPRSLQLAFVIAPTVVAGCALGVAFGAQGVAIGFSAAMLLLVFPAIYWATRGTVISVRDVLRQIWPPLCSIVTAAVVAVLAGPLVRSFGHVLVRLTMETAILFAGYALVLMFVMRQKHIYVGLCRELTGWGNVAVQRV
jgi:O-antigen/teichoic acid export membrane protein